jgi:hypothetical protein
MLAFKEFNLLTCLDSTSKVTITEITFVNIAFISFMQQVID